MILPTTRSLRRRNWAMAIKRERRNLKICCLSIRPARQAVSAYFYGGYSVSHKIGYTDNLLFYISLLNAENVVYTDKALAYYLIDRAGNTMTDLKPQVIDAHAQVFSTILDQAQRCSGFRRCFTTGFLKPINSLFISRAGSRARRRKSWSMPKPLYQLVEKLMPHRAAILDGIKRYG